MKNIFVALLGILSILFSMTYTLPTPSNEETVMPTGYPDGELFNFRLNRMNMRR